MEPLRVAILHYHLRGGGVTRIIEHTLEALKEKEIKLCVITGESPPEKSQIPKQMIGTVPGLSYGEENPERKAEEMLEEIEETASEILGGKPDVWHIHNHSLGKNAEATRAYIKLAEQGYNVLFHIHDFAEDNRPENYHYLTNSDGIYGQEQLTNQLYPLASHIHYAVLNGRDLRFLKAAGLPEDELHLLSNPVQLDVENDQQEAENKGISGKVFLYPCRVIPRKNIGEFVLWAALAEPDEQFAVTLAPKNEKYQADYNKWTDLVEEHHLPVTFEAGQKWDLSFPELLNRADAFISTSIAEGFGLIYLESWLADRPLVGRILPDIVDDFKKKNVRFPGMYKRLNIPVSWIGAEALKEKFKNAITHNLEKYGLPVSETKVQNWLDEIMGDDKVDFGILDVEFQQIVIKKVIDDPSCRKELEPGKLTKNLPDTETIKMNKKIVSKKFSVEKYGARLMTLYKKFKEIPPENTRFADVDSLLTNFQSPQNFSLLRS